jgi:alpha-beta hydrolase superfamily lysophospholipase
MADISEKQFTVITSTGVPLRGDIRWDGEATERQKSNLPIVIVCHGFKAFKDWGPFPAIGRYFASHGFVSIVLNFSHNGIGEEPRKFVEHERFAGNTISLEIDDLKELLNEIDGDCFGLPFLDRSNIALVGHSRGGAVSLIAAHEDERIRAVAAWSTIDHFNRYTDEQKRRWREKGYVQLHSVSSHKIFRISTALLDDVENNAERLNIVKAVEALRKPLLIVHGTADIPVKIEEAERLFAVSDKKLTQFVRLDGAGHMYGAKHPYKEESQTLNHVLDITTRWLQTHLLREV